MTSLASNDDFDVESRVSTTVETSKKKGVSKRQLWTALLLSTGKRLDTFTQGINHSPHCVKGLGWKPKRYDEEAEARLSSPLLQQMVPY